MRTLPLRRTTWQDAHIFLTLDFTFTGNFLSDTRPGLLACYCPVLLLDFGLDAGELLKFRPDQGRVDSSWVMRRGRMVAARRENT